VSQVLIEIGSAAPDPVDRHCWPDRSFCLPEGSRPAEDQATSLVHPAEESVPNEALLQALT
jgi:hypothetical protein